MTPRDIFPDERRRVGEVVRQEHRDPPVDIAEDAENLYVTAEFNEGEVEVLVEARRVVFRGPGLPRGPILVELPAAVDPGRAIQVVRNGVIDVCVPKVHVAPPPP